MNKLPFSILNPARRSFLKTSAAGTALAATSGFLELALEQKDAKAFAHEPYLRDGVYSHVDIKPFIHVLPKAISKVASS